MAITASQVIEEARVLLNDSGKTRYGDDAKLLAKVSAAVNGMRIRRPDLFVGRWKPIPFGLNDPLPVDDERFMGLVHFVAALAEMRDDEYAVAGRVDALTKMAEIYIG